MCNKPSTLENGLHAFEKAGLGKAPFRITGVCEKRGPLLVGTSGGCEIWCGAPGQAMGCCDYCGQGIAECWSIRSADGKDFTVGCDCVRKTGDAGLRKVIDAKKAEISRTKRHAKEAADRAYVIGILADNAARESLAAMPHPKGFVDRKTGTALTMLDQVQWMFDHSGASGTSRLASELRRILVHA